MNKASRISLELVFDFLLVVLGLLILFVSVKDGLGSLSRPGTGMYPLFIAISILVFGGVVLVKKIRSGGAQPLFAEGTFITFILMFATFALWIVIGGAFLAAILGINFLTTGLFSLVNSSFTILNSSKIA